MVEQGEPTLTADTDAIVAAIRTMTGNRQRLPSERELAGRLGVKRHQLRKALEFLRERGELETPSTRRQPAAVLTRYSEQLVHLTSPIEVIEMRLIVEPGLARLASLRASPREITRIARAATTPATAPSGAVDKEFHSAVAAAARNDLASALYGMLREIGVDARLAVGRTDASSSRERIAQRDREHERIADAIAARDPEAAERAMREHLHAVSREIQERATLPSSHAA